MRQLLAGVVLAAALTGCQSEDPYVAPTPTASSDVGRPAVAAATLDQLQRALRHDDSDAAAGLGVDGTAAALLRSVADSATALGLDEVTFRYVAETGRVGEDETWAAAVATTWRVGGFEQVAARAEVEFTFAEGGTRIASIGGGAGRTPVWLSGETSARRVHDAAVLVAADVLPVHRLLAQAEEALTVARRVLGRRADHLVVEVPSSSDALHAALGLPPGTYDAIAAVTTSADGDNVPGAPAHIFLNPDVYGRLGPAEAQVVMSHEAVHALTEAPTSSGVEPWLLEGFADYVALRDVDLPVTRTAGQIIAEVRRDGPPPALPTRVDLDSQADHLGAAYEAAWLVCVTLAESGGEEALVRFYDAVLDGADLETELRARFGLTSAQLTRAWRERLASISGVGG